MANITNIVDSVIAKVNTHTTDIASKVNTSDIGTAATSDVTTSATDTTAGRLLKVGDFGVGRISPTITNLDTLFTSGTYNISAHTTGQPLTGNSGVCFVGLGGAGGVSQTWIKSNTNIDEAYFTRHYNGTTWNDWVETLHTGNEQQIGVGQTWQDVTSSRTPSVTYTNSTGKPIFVVVSAHTGSSGSVSLCQVDGVNVGRFTSAGVTQNNSFIVPSGSTYSAGYSSSNFNLNFWAELR